MAVQTLGSTSVTPFAHLNAEKSALYRAILGVFVSERARFTIALRPPEIAAGLAVRHAADPESPLPTPRVSGARDTFQGAHAPRTVVHAQSAEHGRIARHGARGVSLRRVRRRVLSSGDPHRLVASVVTKRRFWTQLRTLRTYEECALVPAGPLNTASRPPTTPISRPKRARSGRVLEDAITSAQSRAVTTSVVTLSTGTPARWRRCHCSRSHQRSGRPSLDGNKRRRIRRILD